MSSIPNYLQLPWRLQQPENPYIMDGPSGLTGQGPLMPPSPQQPPMQQMPQMALPSPEPSPSLPTGLSQQIPQGAFPPEAAPPQIPGGVSYDPGQMRLNRAEAATDLIHKPSIDTMRLASTPPSTKRAILGGLAASFKPTRQMAPLITYGTKGLAAREEAANYAKELPALTGGYEAQSRMANLDADNRRADTLMNATMGHIQSQMGNERAQMLSHFQDAVNKGHEWEQIDKTTAAALGMREGDWVKPGDVITALNKNVSKTIQRSISDNELQVIAAGRPLKDFPEVTPEIADRALQLKLKDAELEFKVSDKGEVTGINKRTGVVMSTTPAGVGPTYHPPQPPYSVLIQTDKDAAVNRAKDAFYHPEIFQNLSPLERSATEAQLRNEGLGRPVPLTGEAKSRMDNSAITLQHVAQVRALLSDPKLRQAAIGPLSGRFGNLEQGLGAPLFNTNDPMLKQKEQMLRTSLTYLWLREGRALLSGRPAEQLLMQFKATSPNVKQAEDFLNGSLDGAETAAKTNLGDSLRNIWGKLPSSKEQEYFDYLKQQGVSQMPTEYQGPQGIPPPSGPAQRPANTPLNYIQVKRKADNQVGFIDPSKFDAAKYDKIP